MINGLSCHHPWQSAYEGTLVLAIDAEDKCVIDIENKVASCDDLRGLRRAWQFSDPPLLKDTCIDLHKLG